MGDAVDDVVGDSVLFIDGPGERVAVGETSGAPLTIPEAVGEAVVDAVGDVVVDAVALGVAELDAVAALERVGSAVPFVDGAAERVAVCDTSEAPPLG